jgi:hypothetical protein
VRRADCPLCGANLPLRANGVLVRHGVRSDGGCCAGSLLPPKLSHAHFCRACQGRSRVELEAHHGTPQLFETGLTMAADTGWVKPGWAEKAIAQYYRDWAAAIEGVGPVRGTGT